MTTFSTGLLYRVSTKSVTHLGCFYWWPYWQTRRS